MLVLSRRVGERLVIGDDVVVTVIEVRSDGVRLGIDAPRSVRVHRAEVLEAIKASNVEASAVDDDAIAQLRRLVPHAPHVPTATSEPDPDAAPAMPSAAVPAAPRGPVPGPTPGSVRH